MRGDLRELVKAALAGPDLDEGSDRSGTCRKCRASMAPTEPELEPSALCNPCAQDAATVLAAEIVRVYQALASLPLEIGGPILKMLEQSDPEHAKTFVLGVVDRATRHVLGKRPAVSLSRPRGKRRK